MVWSCGKGEELISVLISRCRSEERGLSRKHIIDSVKSSLLRLQLDYIDVVIIHKADPMCPTEGKLQAEAEYFCKKKEILRWCFRLCRSGTCYQSRHRRRLGDVLGNG